MSEEEEDTDLPPASHHSSEVCNTQQKDHDDFEYEEYEVTEDEEEQESDDTSDDADEDYDEDIDREVYSQDEEEDEEWEDSKQQNQKDMDESESDKEGSETNESSKKDKDSGSDIGFPQNSSPSSLDKSTDSPESPRRKISRSERLIGARTILEKEERAMKTPTTPGGTLLSSSPRTNIDSTRERKTSISSSPRERKNTPRKEEVQQPLLQSQPQEPLPQRSSQHPPRSISVFTPKKATNQDSKPVFLVGTGRQKAVPFSPSTAPHHTRTKTQPTLLTFWRPIDSYTEADHQSAAVIQRLVRSRLQRKNYIRLRSYNRHRVRVIEELIATEKTYLRGLEIMEAYRNQFKTDLGNGTQKYLSAEDINHIFLNSVQIRDLNGRFLNDLVERASCKGQVLVGDLFCDYAPYFKSYTDYCRGYENAIQLLRQRRSINPLAFDAYVSDIQKQLGTDGGLPLASLHITPVQRIPRYVLLLKDLLEHTWADHSDRTSITKALDKLGEIANVVNAGVSFADNALKVLSILDQLTGVPDAAEFVTPSRVFVKEGIVQFCNLNAGKKKEFKDHLLYLFNDAIVFARLIGFRQRTITVDDQRLLEKTRKQYRGMIKLSPGNVWFRPVEGNDAIREKDAADYEEIGITNAFFIQTSKRTYVIKCPSSQARTDWLRSFETVMLKIATQINNRNPPPISRATTLGCSDPISNVGVISSPSTPNPQTNSNNPQHQIQQNHGLSASMPLLQGAPGQGGISATIIDTVTKSKKGKEHTAYVLLVNIPNEDQQGFTTKNTIVYRRFREFEALKKTIEKKYDKELSELPAKHYFKNLSKEVISSRRVMLQSFLLELLADPLLLKSPEFLQFLTSPSSD